MFERNYSFFHYSLLPCRCMMFQKQYFQHTKMGGAQASVRGGARAPRSDGTGVIPAQLKVLSSLLIPAHNLAPSFS